MRIVNLISGKDLGGPKQSFVHYSDHLQQLGHHVVSMIRPGAQIEPLLQQRGLSIQRINYPRSRILGLRHVAQHRLKQALAAHSPELVIVHKPIDAALVRPILPINCHLALVLHNYTAQHIDTAHILLPVSPSLAAFVQQRGYHGALLIMPNLIEMDGTQEPVTKPRHQPLAIASMGVMRRTKGQDLLIEALGKLHQSNIPFTASIAGKGRWFKKIQTMIAQQNLGQQVTQFPWISNAERQAFFDAADVICVPSRQETFGMLVTEAMAQKKLVVATRCGGPDGIITDGVNGQLADINSASIANKLTQASELSDAQYQQMCEAAYQHVWENYSQAPFRARLEEMISLVTQ